MRAVIQRVTKTKMIINKKIYSEIDQGLCVFIAIEDTDTIEDIEWLSGKISRLRIFNDYNDVMNLSLKDIQGKLMVVSQFTLFASTKKGNRPSYIRASKPENAIPLYRKFINQLKMDTGLTICEGMFGEDMKVNLINDGPVTIIIDTKNKE